MRPSVIVRPSLSAVRALFLLVVLAAVALPACAQDPAAEPAPAPASTQPAEPPSTQPAVPEPPLPASRTRPEDAPDPLTRAGEQLVRDVVAAYSALPTLTDHVVMEFRIGFELPTQEYRLRIDENDNAWLETEVQEFTALDGFLNVTHNNVRDKYLRVPLVENISASMGTQRSQFIPEFSLRYDRPMKQILRSFLFLVPGDAVISAVERNVENAEGRTVHMLTVLGDKGQSTVQFDAETLLLVGADTEHVPPNAPVGFKVKCHVGFDPQVSETLAEPITFTPGQRTEVSTLAALLDITPTTLGVDVGRPVPEFSLFTLEGEKITLTEQRGRVVVLTLWASNTLMARDELVQAGKLRDWAAAEGLPVTVYPVNVLETATETAGKWEAAMKIWETERYRFPTLFDPDDFLSSALGVEFGVLPLTIVVDEEGMLVGFRRELGERYGDVLQKMIRETLADDDPDDAAPEGPPLPEGPPVPAS